MNVDDVASMVLDAAFRVHTALGPGLLENVYEACMMHELHKAGLRVSKQLPFPIEYDGIRLDVGFRLDLLVEEILIVEIKTVDSLLPIHQAQIMTYLRISKLTLGLLINFNVPHLKHGIKRVVLNHDDTVRPAFPRPRL